MSAAAARSGLAAIGRDLFAREGGPGARRALRLARALAGRDERPITFTDLAGVPEWLRLPATAHARLARHAALVAMAPHLAASIDGQWLGRLAEAAGENALDWAIAQADAIGASALPALPGEELEPVGFALLRGSLPLALRDLIVANDRDLPPDLCLRCTDLALHAPEAA